MNWPAGSASTRPRVTVVLTTGYAAEEARQDPAAEAAAPILRKPYKRAELAIALCSDARLPARRKRLL